MPAPMRTALSIILPLLALVAGIAAGDLLRPDRSGQPTTGAGDASGTAALSDLPQPDSAAAPDQDPKGEAAADLAPAWFTFPSQFFVPMMRNGDMGAIMILTLSIETAEDQLEAMKRQEHRLRDGLLRQLMIHANTGGFDGNFTSEASMRVLRERLLDAARSATDLPVEQVLIEDIARQAG